MDILQLSASLFYNQLSLETLFWNFMHASSLGEISEHFSEMNLLICEKYHVSPFTKDLNFIYGTCGNNRAFCMLHSTTN